MERARSTFRERCFDVRPGPRLRFNSPQKRLDFSYETSVHVEVRGLPSCRDPAWTPVPGFGWWKRRPGAQAKRRQIMSTTSLTTESASGAAGKSARARLRPGEVSKGDRIIRLLRRRRGASISEIQKVTNWQAHSVRGFLSGTVRKRMGLPLVSERGAKGGRRYRIVHT